MAEDRSSQADGGDLRGGYRVNALVRDIRQQVPEDLRHYRRIYVRPASYNQLTLRLPNA